MKTITITCVVLALLSACTSVTKSPTQPLSAPLFDDLGTHHHAISTDVPLAQRYFDQGLILAYGFNHAEALRSFEAAAKLDPNCAMCFWGQAFVRGPNINKPMDDADVAAAYAAAQKALALSATVSAREQAYIEALAQRYAPAPVADRSALDRAYAEAMRGVVKRHGEDLDARALFAEAQMDLMPWDYWTKDLEPKPATSEVIATLEGILKEDPAHVGAIHFYIHIVEASTTPERAEPYADRLRNLVPGAGHLVHMPSHIYIRVGRYHDASVANELAASADESYIAQCNAQGFYPALYYPHNIHFLWFSSAMEGRSAVSIEAARKLARNIPIEQIPQLPFLEFFLPMPLFGLVQFGKWDEILAEPAPPGELIYWTAIWHYARGLAYLAQGDFAAAKGEGAALTTISKSDDLEAMEVPLLMGKSLIFIATDILNGELAGAERLYSEQINALKMAVERQDALPYMEPPYWYYPVRQSLGVALLNAEQPAQAEAVYSRDLEINRENARSLYGLAQSLRAQHRDAEAAQATKRFTQAWSRADVTLTTSRF